MATIGSTGQQQTAFPDISPQLLATGPPLKILVTNLPKILVTSLFSSSSKWINRFFKCLESLDYPKDKLRFAFLEGGSQDNTWNILKRYKDTHPNVWLSNRASNIPDRYERLAFLRNCLIDEALQDEAYVFSVDSDLVHIPPETLKTFISYNVDIIAPYIFIEGKTQFYDTLAFRYQGLNFSHTFPYCPIRPIGIKIGEITEIINGLTKRLKRMDRRVRWTEEGRLKIVKYLSQYNAISYISGLQMSGLQDVLKNKELWRRNAGEAIFSYIRSKPVFEVDSVGTCYLVKRQVYDERVRYEGGDSEQVVFCNNARTKGFKVWVDPSLTLMHVDLERHGEKWH